MTKNLPEKVGIIYSEAKREYFPTEAQYLTEKDAKRDAMRVASYLAKLGVKAKLYPGNSVVPAKLKKGRLDMVFNLVDSVRGSEYLASVIPATLELLELPYTGSGIMGKSLDCNKFLIKKLIQQNGIPTPAFQLFNNYYTPLDPSLRFPLISKLNEIHGGVEITRESVSENEKHLRDRLKYLIKTYNQPVLVEEFIVGREVTGYVLEGSNKKVYLAEKVFRDTEEKYVFSTFEDQWLTKGEGGFHFQKYRDPLLKEYVKKAFEVCKMADYGKFDIRIDSSGRYSFIDINHNPAFGPKENDCAMGYILEMYGISFLQTLKRLIANTMRDAEGKKLLPP